ncbi:hypothetical protein LY90DRAFT_440279 [Neocallimastix californiae]|uniref:Histone acetyltransferase n=1 Tax=Neocallimastix californiae TaxID=1754190 RepID=A0A1Y1ZDK8_9FUNG|nr:hypothetical protein LY90DRAFT_440279 [Neocallimastix californiae]|eukprot:ORY07895.1 hypothetical protein LY90DRAFT_440279 [Neocallimastix californiae]
MKAKKILEANKQEESLTPIDEYSEQILKADQSLKEDCIKPVDISKNKAIKFGSYLIKMWFASPYPAEYSERPILYLCEYCFKYLNSEYALMRHQKKCPIKVPPGNEIYRDKNISIFEVDGRKNKIYCQNLCLLSKLFLDHKTLYYDVEPFLFYIMTLPKNQHYKFVGYFSKEKQCESGYNLSCLLTLPIYQRKGYGNALIAFSYMLSKIEGKTGSPEKPLSDFGLRSYRKYWRYNVFKALTELHLLDDELTIDEISRMTSISENDILCTLYNSGLLKKYELFIDTEKIINYVKDEEAKIKIKLDPKYLRWNLYNMPVS